MNEDIYYVYKYVKENNLPYYIGMGHGSRINDPHNNVKTPDKKYRHFVQENMSEKDALALERILTETYGLLKDGLGILENKIHGGHASPCGMLGKKQKEELKLKISNSNKGKVRSKEQRQNYKKPKTKEHAENIRKAVLNNLDPNRYVYDKSFAHKGRPWSQARRDAQNKKAKQ